MMWHYACDIDRACVDRWNPWILYVASGAARSNRAVHRVSLATGVHQRDLNRSLQEALLANLELVGPAQFVEEEQSFSRALQAQLELNRSATTPT